MRQHLTPVSVACTKKEEMTSDGVFVDKSSPQEDVEQKEFLCPVGGNAD